MDHKRRIAAKLFWFVAAIAAASLLAGVLEINDLPSAQGSDGWRNYWLGLGIGTMAALCAWTYLLRRRVDQDSDETLALRVVQLIPVLGGFGIFLSRVTDETPLGVALSAGLGGWLVVSLIGLRLDWKRRKIFHETASSAQGSGHD